MGDKEIALELTKMAVMKVESIMTVRDANEDIVHDMAKMMADAYNTIYSEIRTR